MKCGGMLKSLVLPGAILLAMPALTFAQNYQQTNLVSDIASMAPQFDPNLKNPWGITRSAGGPWWVSNNNSGTSTLYNGAGTPVLINPPNDFITVPPPTFEPTAVAAPTGIVFNGNSKIFLLKNGTTSAHFIFDSEDGTIVAWGGGATAELEVDNSENGSPNGAVYKGATSGSINGQTYLYVTNFRRGRVEVYKSDFTRAHFGEHAFDPNADCDGDDHHDGGDHDDCDDERVPEGFAPFNIQNIGDTLFVTYAKQDAPRHDEIKGDGLGYVKIFSLDGKLIGHLPHGNYFNAPWGVVWTTRDFGTFSNSILVGNFGSGWIAAFDGFSYKFKGFVQNPDNSLMTIDGLWSLTFANDGSAGTANTLYFSAGINDENDGLFGTITPTDGTDGSNE